MLSIQPFKLFRNPIKGAPGAPLRHDAPAAAAQDESLHTGVVFACVVCCCLWLENWTKLQGQHTAGAVAVSMRLGYLKHSRKASHKRMWRKFY